MEYKGFENSDVSEYVERRGVAVGSPLPGGTPEQSIHLNLFFGVALISSLCLAALSGNEWGYHDLHSQCDMLNSGTQYLSSINAIMSTNGCKAPNSDGSCTFIGFLHKYSPTKCCPPNVIADEYTCTAKNGITTMKGCIEAVCGKSDIYYGQCHAPGWGMWGGSLGIFAVIAAYLAVYRVDSIATGANIACAVLAAITVGCSATCFMTSYYFFGSGNADDRENFKMDGNIIGADCNYTYSDARGDYQAMSAFAFMTAGLILVVSVISCLVSYQNQQYVEQKADLNQGLQTSMNEVQNEFM